MSEQKIALTDQNFPMIKRFNHINDEINALYHRASAKLGFADSEMLILYLLSDYGDGLTQSRIIELTSMSKQTVNSAVSRMAKAGWIILGEKSGRRRSIALADAGKRILAERLGGFRKQEENIFDSWTAEEKDTLLILMRRYRDTLKTIVEELPERKKELC